MQYRKKPVVIEAVQYEGTPESVNAVRDFVGDSLIFVDTVNRSGYYAIKTLEGIMRIETGDYVIRGVKGEFYPCKPDIFKATYDAIDADDDLAPPDGSTGFSFGAALSYLLGGRKLRRAGWNGKGMYIVLMPGFKLPAWSDQSANAKVNDRTAAIIGKDTPLDAQPYLAMWTAAGQWQPGWLASQADLLADDWELA